MELSVRKILLFFSLFFVLTTGGVLTGLEPISSAVAGLEFGLMSYLFCRYVILNSKLRKSESLFVYLFTTFSIFHFFVNTSNSDIPTFLKIVAPITFYFTGKYVENKSFDVANKSLILFSICILPVLIRLMQVATAYPSDVYYSIFVNSNNFSYYFLVVSMLVFLISNRKLYSFLYLGFGFTLSRTIGAFLAFALGYALSLGKMLLRPKVLVSLFSGFGLLVGLILYSNIEIFERIRNSYLTFQSLTSTSGSIGNLKSIEYGDAIGYVQGDQNDLSFLFRIKNWSEIIAAFSNSDFKNVLFGNGFLSVTLITSTGLVAHNDYLGLIYEYGLLPAGLLILTYWQVLRSLKFKELNVAFFAVAIYHFTENLYYNFLITSLHFLILGLVTSQNAKYENTSNQ